MTEMHRIACALLVRDGRALLGHRSPAKQFYPDCWDLPGGHVDPGETAEEALVRECREELGIEITEYRRVDMGIDHPNLGWNSFVVTGWTGEPANTAPEEHDALGWFTPEEIPGLVLALPEYATALPAAIRAAG